MMLPQCLVCKWYLEGTKTCPAFPDGIPDKYFMANSEPYYDNYSPHYGERRAHTKIDPDQVGEYVYNPAPRTR